MSSEDGLALFERAQTSDVTQPIADGDQGAAWITQAAGSDAVTAPPPPLPMPEAVTPVTPPPPPAMPEAGPAPATTMAAPATTAAAPAEKSTGGWEVDAYRLRAFGDAVVRARSYLDAVRMKVDRMQGAELTPQLGTSPVGQQLAKKFDDRLNADQGLRAMLTEAMKRMEKFVASAEDASRAYEQAEESATDTFDNFIEVDWWDQEAAEQGYDQHDHHHHHDHDHGEDADDEARDDVEDETDDEREDGARDETDERDEADEPRDETEHPADEPAADVEDEQPQDDAEDKGEDKPDDRDDQADDRDDQAQDDAGDADDRADDAEDKGRDRPEDRGEDRGAESAEGQDEQRPRHGRGKPG